MIMRDSRFEPEAAGDGEMIGGALMVPHVVRTRTVRSESGDMEMQPTINTMNFSILASLCPERQKKGSQAFPNSSSILSKISPNPRTPSNKNDTHTEGREQEAPYLASTICMDEPMDPRISNFSPTTDRLVPTENHPCTPTKLH